MIDKRIRDEIEELNRQKLKIEQRLRYLTEGVMVGQAKIHTLKSGVIGHPQGEWAVAVLKTFGLGEGREYKNLFASENKDEVISYAIQLSKDLADLASLAKLDDSEIEVESDVEIETE